MINCLISISPTLWHATKAHYCQGNSFEIEDTDKWRARDLISAP
jgi:hypothetical protein